jgi:hypothetical protein
VRLLDHFISDGEQRRRHVRTLQLSIFECTPREFRILWLIANSSMFVEPDRRKSKNSTLLYLHVSQMLSRMRKSRRPFSVALPAITRRSDANAFTACSALLLFHGTSSKSKEVNILLRFFSKRSMSFLCGVAGTKPTSETFVEPGEENPVFR